MSDLRKAAEMALEALERLDGWLALRYGNELTQPEREVVKALRQALAQPVDAVNMSQERVDETEKREREPVGFFSINDYGNWEENENGYGEPLYTAPPKREWVGLNFFEQTHLRTIYAPLKPLHHYIKENTSVAAEVVADWGKFFAAIEAKLKEKNNG